MKVLITGTSKGIGRAIAEKFLSCGHEVVGIDVLPSAIENTYYTHFVADIFSGELPALDGVEILINNAGVQDSGRDIDVNLKGSIRVTEKYVFQKNVKSGVKTALNDRVMNDPELWNRIMNETLLPKWAEAEEIAEWAYFMTVVNRSMTAQDLLIDNGEDAKANFIW